MKFSLTLFLLAAACVAGATAGSSAGDTPKTTSAQVKLDQVGYLPKASKLAMISAPAQEFTVRRIGDSGVVFSGKLGAPVADADSGDSVQIADFSGLRETGNYYLDVPGVGRSWKFAIGPDVYSHAYKLAMLGFYGQRCGTAVDLGPEFPGYSHPPCHMDSKFHKSAGPAAPRVITGGWHDAGDYGRYTVNSGITTGTLLWTWELFAKKIQGLRLHIPESGGTTPDFLSEVRWNLEWMLKMQDSDGGVWHKETTENFGGFIMPETEKTPVVVIGTGAEPFKNTCASANLAAVGAIAARVYPPYDRAFAARSLQAARQAWAWAESHPKVIFRNPPGVGTGEYGDGDCSDELLWAAAELWRTTGDASFNRYFVEHYPSFNNALAVVPPEDWNQLAPMALMAYALGNRPGSNAQIVAEIRKNATAAAREIVKHTRENGYRVSLLTKDYVWGSNGIAASYGVQLLVANVLSPDPSFVETAADDLHYLLGRNANGLSYVTRLGENPFGHPHHRPSGARPNMEPWPGLLSGGPNAGRQDAILAKLPPLSPAKVYADQTGSYASNEIAINWQATLVFLLAGLQN